jgi:hypothetical protein
VSRQGAERFYPLVPSAVTPSQGSRVARPLKNSSAGGAMPASVLQQAQGVERWPIGVTLAILNLCDGVFTLVYLLLGQATEANPLMRLAFAVSPLAFMALKLLLVDLGLFVLWRCRAAPLADVALGLGLGAYGSVVAWHLAHAPLMLRAAV